MSSDFPQVNLIIESAIDVDFTIFFHPI